MKIITLIENLVYQRGFHAEHGISMLIETENKKILFDTGQTDAFIKNAQKLNIDITTIDAVVLSHGHYDHTGGLYHFLQINTKAKVYCKREVFEPKYNIKNDFIGTQYIASVLENRIIYVNQTTEIVKNVFIMPNIPIVYNNDTSIGSMKVESGKGLEQDTFMDELFIAFTVNNKLSVLSGCSHRGITNILTAAIDKFNLPIHLIMGGLHIKDSNSQQYSHIIKFLQSAEPEKLGVCHCTGITKYAQLMYDCNLEVFYNETTNKIIIS
jgi:7,8-dihydropterin-6-yl-methyl-4-(beta-D-ribofuranosyl)aminobenzene 5'-phosphate synthase